MQTTKPVSPKLGHINITDPNLNTGRETSQNPKENDDVTSSRVQEVIQDPFIDEQDE